MSSDASFLDQCRAYLEKKWQHICKETEEKAGNEPLGDKFKEIKSLIVDCLTSNTKTYHYVLPTQLLSKCVNHNVDIHSIQTAYGKKGAFDARTIAHGAIVPFDKTNYNVLGGSSEPYVNNPLRCPAITAAYRSQQKNKTDWDKLITVLDFIESKNNKKVTQSVFDQVLFEIHKLLTDVRILYPTPNRISLNQTIQIVSQFTADKSGGDRIEAVCTALFRTIGKQFNLFDEVKREKVNAADASSGMVADIECWLNGTIVLLIEVKDRSLTLIQLDSKLDIARSRKVSEILFLAEQGIEKAEKEKAEKRIRDEFVSGQNIYVSNFIGFSTGVLILLGEKGRVQFLSQIGDELDRTNSAIVHRRAWANFLKTA